MIRICACRLLDVILGSLLITIALCGCGRSTESKVAGTWTWKSCDAAGDIAYRKDHTFVSREWALSHTQQPPVIFDTGDWRVQGGQLILNFKGDSRPPDARHVTLSFILFGEDVLIIRGSNGLIRTFERVR